jgi:hypothetical protein
MFIKHLNGRLRVCLCRAPSIDEQREAKRLQRHTRPALTKHTDINRQRTPSNRPPRKPIRKAKP